MNKPVCMLLCKDRLVEKTHLTRGSFVPRLQPFHGAYVYDPRLKSPKSLSASTPVSHSREIPRGERWGKDTHPRFVLINISVSKDFLFFILLFLEIPTYFLDQLHLQFLESFLNLQSSIILEKLLHFHIEFLFSKKEFTHTHTLYSIFHKNAEMLMYFFLNICNIANERFKNTRFRRREWWRKSSQRRVIMAPIF